jgi:hypothetical protein
VGKSRGLASLAGAAGRLLVQEGRRDEVLLLPSRIAWGVSSVMSNSGEATTGAE